MNKYLLRKKIADEARNNFRKQGKYKIKEIAERYNVDTHKVSSIYKKSDEQLRTFKMNYGTHNKEKSIVTQEFIDTLKAII